MSENTEREAFEAHMLKQWDSSPSAIWQNPGGTYVYVQSEWEAWTASRKQALEEAAQICEAERVDAQASGASDDRAYNLAIEHCTEAIRQAAQQIKEQGNG